MGIWPKQGMIFKHIQGIPLYKYFLNSITLLQHVSFVFLIVRPVKTQVVCKLLLPIKYRQICCRPSKSVLLQIPSEKGSCRPTGNSSVPRVCATSRVSGSHPSTFVDMGASPIEAKASERHILSERFRAWKH